MTLLYILLAGFAGGALALLCAYTLFHFSLWNHARAHLFLSFSAGTLLGVAFFDLIPESIEQLERFRPEDPMELGLLFVLAGFLLFFLIEKLILWHHCHEDSCRVQNSVPMVILGDTIHNALDGVAIATAFLISPAIGLATTIAIFAHEIPQEVADFSILLQSGMSKRRALMFNLLVSLTSVLTAVLTYFLALQLGIIAPILTALTAGGLLYIASADLIPEIHQSSNKDRVMTQTLIFLSGIGMMFLISSFFHHAG